MSEINLEKVVSELQSDFALLTSAIENGAPINGGMVLLYCRFRLFLFLGELTAGAVGEKLESGWRNPFR